MSSSATQFGSDNDPPWHDALRMSHYIEYVSSWRVEKPESSSSPVEQRLNTIPNALELDAVIGRCVQELSFEQVIRFALGQKSPAIRCLLDGVSSLKQNFEQSCRQLVKSLRLCKVYPALSLFLLIILTKASSLSDPLIFSHDGLLDLIPTLTKWMQTVYSFDLFIIDALKMSSMHSNTHNHLQLRSS